MEQTLYFYRQAETEFLPRRKEGYIFKHNNNTITYQLQYPAGYENCIKRISIFVRKVRRMKDATGSGSFDPMEIVIL